MELALMTEPQLGGTHDDLLAAARWAEENGFVSFARSDHYDWQRDGDPNATDAFVSLGGLARETSTIRLGTGAIALLVISVNLMADGLKRTLLGET